MDNVSSSLANQTGLFYNRYYIYRTEIGTGSFAKVYKAIDTHTADKDFVAIKKIAIQKLSKTLLDRFQREIQIMKTLNHSNVISMRTSYVNEKSIYIIMEYCNSGSLKQRYYDMSITEKQLRFILNQIFQGMNYLDTQGVFHRDIKPENILIHNEHPEKLIEKDVIKITDFGFSNYIRSEEEMYTTICGTPLYMSPELLKGKPYTKKSDIWSIGIIAYELFHKRHPYGKPRSMPQLYNAIKNTPIQYSDTCSPLFIDLLNGLLDIDESKRLSYAEILAHPWFHAPSPSRSKQPDGGDIFSMEIDNRNSSVFSDALESDIRDSIDKYETDSDSEDVGIEQKPQNFIENYYASPQTNEAPLRESQINNSISPLTPYALKKSIRLFRTFLGSI
jgi:serine/threonine protein kinase